MEKLFLDPNSKIVNGPYALFSLLPSLIGKDPYQSILAGVTKGEYAGVDTIDGIECNHMTFAQDTFSWDLWTQVDGQPWVIKVAPALVPDSTLDKPIIKTTGKLSLNFRYKNSIANPKLKDAFFTFDAPPESKQIPSLGTSAETADALKAGSEDKTSSKPTDDEKPSPNLGKPSPPLKGSLMDGGAFDLSEYKGKKVVVLEFFAGWCPDCRKTLPAVHKTVKPYLHKDVVFYLVDQPDHENKPDNEDKVKEYLKAHDLPVPVIQDGSRKAHTDFGVRPIPHLVVVDKEGVIRFDESSMTLDSDLERELKKLSTQE
jgi:thiol-disulfide isomerase/thioredoxin